eukprot:SAG31_NODE_209_length_20304_cov_9.850285_6_plen_308_part_00
MIPQQQALPRTAPSGLVAPRVVGRHGNTGKGRLDLLDALLQMYEPELFSIDTSVGVEQDTQRAQSFDVCVDVGFGDSVHTFVDFARNLHARRMMGTLLVIGTESNSKRLASGKANLKDLFDGSMQKADSVELRLGEVKGWFALPLHGTEPAPAFIRALNVLRDYHPSDALHALHTLGAQLKYGGLLMEGSASTHGHTAVVALVRRGAKGACAEATRGQVEDVATQLRLEALCFCVDFRGDGPRLKGCPNRWFSRQIPQLWQHQRTKFGRSTNTKGQEPVPKKRKHGGKRGQKWHGGGGCVRPSHYFS